MLHRPRLPYRRQIGKIQIPAFAIDAFFCPSATGIPVTPVPAFAAVPFACHGVDTPAHTIGQV